MEDGLYYLGVRRKTSARGASSHRLKWGPSPPNEVGRISQHVRKGEGRKKGWDGGVGVEAITRSLAIIPVAHGAIGAAVKKVLN